jgi:hypothetical protein
MYQYHQNLEYIKAERVPDTFADKQRLVFTAELLKKFQELIFQHFELQRPIISYFICYQIIQDIIQSQYSFKLYSLVAPSEYGAIPLPKFIYIDGVPQLTNDSLAPDYKAPIGKRKKELEEVEIDTMKMLSLEVAKEPDLIERINNYLRQLYSLQLDTFPINTFMNYISGNQVKFILADEVDLEALMTSSSEVLSEKKVFKIDHRATSSICYLTNSPIVELLIDHGIQLNSLNSLSETPIYEVIRSYNLPLFTKLLNNGASMFLSKNIGKERAIDVLCKLLLEQCNYDYIALQHSTILKHQIQEISDRYSLDFIDKMMAKVLETMWRPIPKKTQRITDLNPGHRTVEEVDLNYNDYLFEMKEYPKDNKVFASKQQPIYNIKEVLDIVKIFATKVQSFFKNSVLYLGDVAEMHHYSQEVKELHGFIYRFMEIQLESTNKYDQLIYSFQDMIDEIFNDVLEKKVRKENDSELFQFIVQIIMLHIAEEERESMLPVIKEQLMTLEGEIKKRIQFHIMDPSKDINVLELAKNMFDILSGMPAIKGKRLDRLQNLVVLLYEKVFNTLRDLYFNIGSIHMKIHILLTMAHSTFKQLEEHLR